jgi:malate synthase
MGVRGVDCIAPIEKEYEQILTPGAVEFLAELHRRFNPRRIELLVARHERQTRIVRGERPDFLPETKDIREGKWKVSPFMESRDQSSHKRSGITDFRARPGGT